METRPSHKMALTQRKTNSSEPLRPILGQRLKPAAGGSSVRRALSSLGTNNRRANLRLAQSLLTISASEFRDKWNFDPVAETPLPQGQFLWTPVKLTPSNVPLVPVKLAAEVRPKTEAESDLAACFRLPQKDVANKLNGENITSEVSENQTPCIQTMGQTCTELRCLSVKETSCSEINKSLSPNTNKQLCSDGENNNSLLPFTSTSTNQRQAAITEFLRTSKRPLQSYVSCEAPTGTSLAPVAGTTPPPAKLRRIMSDGDNT